MTSIQENDKQTDSAQGFIIGRRRNRLGQHGVSVAHLFTKNRI